jgi:hypothetical protein
MVVSRRSYWRRLTSRAKLDPQLLLFFVAHATQQRPLCQWMLLEREKLHTTLREY